MEYNKYKFLVNYLVFLRDSVFLDISFRDLSGFLSIIDKGLSLSLMPFVSHSNSHCKKYKEDYGMLSKCVKMATPISRKCKKLRKAFFGTCYAGVNEFIIPIFSNYDDLIGFISVGSFQLENGNIKQLIPTSDKNGKCDDSKSEEKYEVSGTYQFNCETIENAFGFVVKEVVENYDKNRHKKINNFYRSNSINEEITVTKIIDIIRRNYSKTLYVSEIAGICRCSESYINHTFKQKTGVTIRELVNWYRVDKAKELLKKSDYSMTQLAFEIGFNDSNYFSKVFSSLTGMTPTQFKRSNT